MPTLTPLAPLLSSAPGQQVAVVGDDKAITALVELLITQSGMTQTEIARRLGIRVQSLAPYRTRKRPSLKWIIRLADAVGAKVWVELPR